MEIKAKREYGYVCVSVEEGNASITEGFLKGDDPLFAQMVEAVWAAGEARGLSGEEGTALAIIAAHGKQIALRVGRQLLVQCGECLHDCDAVLTGDDGGPRGDCSCGAEANV